MNKINISNNLQNKIYEIEQNVLLNVDKPQNYLIFAPNGVGKTYFTEHFVNKLNDKNENILKFEKKDFIELKQENNKITINFKNPEIQKLENELSELDNQQKEFFEELKKDGKSLEQKLKSELKISKKIDIKDTMYEYFWKINSLKNINMSTEEIKLEPYSIDNKELEFVQKRILDSEETKKHNKKLLQHYNKIKDLLIIIKESSDEEINIHKKIWLKSDINFESFFNNYSEFEYNETMCMKYENFTKQKLINIFMSIKFLDDINSINFNLKKIQEVKLKYNKKNEILVEKKQQENDVFNNIKKCLGKLNSVLSKVLFHNENINIKINSNEKNKTVEILGIESAKFSKGEEEAILLFSNLMSYINDYSHQNIKYLILDDPITSIDSTNLEYFVYMFNDIMSSFKTKFKFIILTHYVSLFESFLDQFGSNKLINLEMLTIGILPNDEKERDIYSEYIDDKKGKFIFPLMVRKKILNRELNIDKGNDILPFVDDFHYYFDTDNVTNNNEINIKKETLDSLESVVERINMVKSFINKPYKIEKLEIKHKLLTSIRIWIEKNLYKLCELKNIEIKKIKINNILINYQNVNYYLSELEKKYNQNNMEEFIELKTNILICKTLFNKLIHSSNYINTYESLLSTTDLKISEIVKSLNNSFNKLIGTE